MDVKELLNQPLIKLPTFESRRDDETGLDLAKRIEKETTEAIDALVDEFEKDKNPTTAGNLCLQLLFLGNNKKHRKHMMDAMKNLLRSHSNKPIICNTDEWVIWARTMKEHVYATYPLKYEEVKDNEDKI